MRSTATFRPRTIPTRERVGHIKVAVAASAVPPDIRVVLRAGGDDIVAETTSLFRIGDVRDVAALTACAVARGVLGLLIGLVGGRRHGLRADDSGTGAVITERATMSTAAPREHHRPLRGSEGQPAR